MAASTLMVSFRRSGEVYGVIGHRDMTSKRYTFDSLEPFVFSGPPRLAVVSGILTFGEELVRTRNRGVR